MERKSTQIALGGVFSALCLLLMFMTGLVPFSTYAMPALSGAMLIAVVVENGSKAALLVYVSVSVLSVFIVPDRESTMMFIAFFGYYPVIKEKLERIQSRIVEYAIKLLLFNMMILLGYMTIIQLFGMPSLADDLGDFGQYTVLVMLGLGNLVFLCYDFALTRYISLYIHWFKPRFLRK